MRTLWMAHELGLDFRHERGFREEAVMPTEALPAANPMGQAPAIDEDGFLLSESMAINIYLARKHGKLAPRSQEEEAQTLRWSFLGHDRGRSHAARCPGEGSRLGGRGQ